MAQNNGLKILKSVLMLYITANLQGAKDVLEQIRVKD